MDEGWSNERRKEEREGEGWEGSGCLEKLFRQRTCCHFYMSILIVFALPLRKVRQ